MAQFGLRLKPNSCRVVGVLYCARPIPYPHPAHFLQHCVRHLLGARRLAGEVFQQLTWVVGEQEKGERTC